MRSGVVHRYRPAFSHEAIFITRHLELTNSMLKYYGKPPANHPNLEPLFRIPVDQISKASWVIPPNKRSPVRQSTEDLINKIANANKEELPFCFEI